MSAITERWLFVFRDHAVPENIEKTIEWFIENYREDDSILR